MAYYSVEQVESLARSLERGAHRDRNAVEVGEDEVAASLNSGLTAAWKTLRAAKPPCTVAGYRPTKTESSALDRYDPATPARRRLLEAGCEIERAYAKYWDRVAQGHD